MIEVFAASVPEFRVAPLLITVLTNSSPFSRTGQTFKTSFAKATLGANISKGHGRRERPATNSYEFQIQELLQALPWGYYFEFN
jgi:hypothetical protein